jgi:hypothetical protein
VVACAPAEPFQACTFVTPTASVRITERINDWVDVAVLEDGVWRPLPPRLEEDVLYGACVLDERQGAPPTDAVTTHDVNGDGRPDVTVAAGCASGAGPEGARTRPTGAVYLRLPSGGYTSDRLGDSTYTAALTASGCTEAVCDYAAARRMIRTSAPAQP